MQSSNGKKSIAKYIPAFVFLLFIFGMGIWFLFCPKSDYSTSEKRYLQEFPETSAQNIADGQFGSEFESYFADHFPARNFWMGLNSYCALGAGNNGANGVYFCSDGYLINVPVSADNRLEKNTEAIVNFKNSIDVPLSVMLVPSTGYVAGDVLPAVHDKYNDDEYFDCISQTLGENGIGFTDLRGTFKNEYKNGNQLYYKTDHHWTTSGAYAAYTELCKNLDIKPAPKDSFEIEQYGDFYGTTYSTSGFWLNKPDRIEIWNNPDNTDENINVKITEGTESEEYGSMYFYDRLDDDDKYPVFLDGNHALTEITNTNADGGTIVLIKDSFSHCIAPFIAENYSKTVLVDMRYYKQNVSELVKQENAEQVLVLYGIDNLATDTDIVWLN